MPARPDVLGGNVTGLSDDKEVVLMSSVTLSIWRPRDMANHVIPLAIRLQLQFAARRSEIVSLKWEWLDLERGGTGAPTSCRLRTLSRQFRRLCFIPVRLRPGVPPSVCRLRSAPRLNYDVQCDRQFGHP